MARLALALDRDVPEGADTLALNVRGRTAEALFRHLGQPVLFYKVVPEIMLLFLGRGRVAGLESLGDGRLIGRLDRVERFLAPVSAVSEASAPGVKTHLALGGERFQKVLDDAGVGLDAGATTALAEAALQFERAARTGGAAPYLAIHDQVLGRWDYRCAFTGARFAAARERPHPDLSVIAIQPREQGGPLHTRNFLPATADAAQAFQSGALAVGSDYGLVVAAGRIEAGLTERLLPHLLLPEDDALWPSPELLRYHRREIAGL